MTGQVRHHTPADLRVLIHSGAVERPRDAVNVRGQADQNRGRVVDGA
jgi:hypothetical protein